MDLSNNFFIKDGYQIRTKPDYFQDKIIENITNQPEVYLLAGYLAEKFDCKYIIDIGCGNLKKLLPLNKFELIGIDFGDNIKNARRINDDKLTLIEVDLENDRNIPIQENILSNSLIICSDVIEHLINPDNLLKILKKMSDISPICIISTPERDISRGISNCGPPTNSCHCREWNMMEFRKLLQHYEINPEFIGLTVQNDYDWIKRTMLVIIRKNILSIPKTPYEFKITVFLVSYNDEDIIDTVIKNLIHDGIQIYLIDRGSNDLTVEIAKKFLGKGVLNIECFNSDNKEWITILERIELLSKEIESNWFIRLNANEIINSPYPDIILRDAIYRVDWEGFNSIDHIIITFYPNDEFVNTDNFIDSFKYFEFNKITPQTICIRTWKNLKVPITLTKFGRQQVVFNNQKIYPFKFLLREYPFRKQKQIVNQFYIDNELTSFNFLKSSESFSLYQNDFNIMYLVERLSGIGIHGTTTARLDLNKSLKKCIHDVDILQKININNQKLINEYGTKINTLVKEIELLQNINLKHQETIIQKNTQINKLKMYFGDQ